MAFFTYIFVSHTSFLTVGHLCDIVVANLAKWSWPTSSQNQIDARTEAAWPEEAFYVRELGWATTRKWFGFLSKYHLQRIGSRLSGWMVSSINKIYVIGQTAIHTYSMSHHCIPKKVRFAAVYGSAASLGRTSSLMIKTGTLLWMEIATVQW